MILIIQSEFNNTWKNIKIKVFSKCGCIPISTYSIPVSDTTKCYKSIIDKIFPNQILLKHCKRCDTNEDNKLVDEISKKFREFISGMVNSLLHKYVDNQKYYVSKELLGK